MKHQEGSDPITMAYDSANRIVTSAQGSVVTTYTSDANGNLTVEDAGGSVTSFLYDNENRLTTLQHAGGGISSYTYAGGFPVQGEGLRRSHHAPGGSLTTVIWDGSDYLMEKGGGATVRYVASEGEMLAEKRSGVRLAFVPDPLGSVIGLLNSSQTFTDTFAFWPYGEVRLRTGSTRTPFQWVGTLGYYWELEWLYYIRARYELALLGRWLTEDVVLSTLGGSLRRQAGAPGNRRDIGSLRISRGPQTTQMENPLNADRLAYALGNPMSYSDPSGNVLPIIGLVILLVKAGLTLAAAWCLGRSIGHAFRIVAGPEDDDWKHCVLGCSITRDCLYVPGYAVCHLAAWANEVYNWIQGVLGVPTYGFDMCDIIAQSTGCGCGFAAGKSCEQCCQCVHPAEIVSGVRGC